MTAGKDYQVLGVDVARFVAASLVVSLHLWGARAHASGGFLGFALGSANCPIADAGLHRLPAIAFVGAIGVQVFFAISGVVIAYSAVNARSWREFLYKRVMRLGPTLWVCTLISASIGLCYGYFTPGEALLRTMRSFVILPVMPKIDDVVWTLNLEAAFYLLVALTIALGKAQKLLHLAYGLTTVSLLYWLAYFASGCSTGEEAAASNICGCYLNPYFAKLTSLLLVQHGAFFSFGILIWSLCGVGLSRASAAMLLLTIATCVLQLKWTASYYFIQFGDAGASAGAANIVTTWALIMMVIVLSMLYRRRLAELLSKWEGFIRVIGRSTYPLYLLHGFVGGATVALLTGYGWPPFSAFLVALCVSAAAAAVVAVFVEPLVNGAIRGAVFRGAALAREATEARRAAKSRNAAIKR